MCEDHQPGQLAHQAGPELAGPELSRRHFIHGSAAAAAAAALLRRGPRLPLHSSARQAAGDGTPAYSMAMHIHSSFSEQDGSMQSQLYQAAKNAVDVLWWTDHDARMLGLDYRDVVHFTSLTGENGGPGQGGAWIWQKAESGSLTSKSGGGIVTEPCSPNDPVAGGSMSLAAQSTGTSLAKFGYYAQSHPAGWNYRDNLTGQSLLIDVLLNSGWSHGYLELLIGTSYHEASAGRAAGNYSLSYQFVPSGTQTRAANGNNGVITIPVTANGSTWTTVTITPSDDIAALWPDLDYRDFALWNLTLSAASTGDAVSGNFDYLRFDRTISGETYLEQQASMGTALAPAFPNVVQQQGLEVSQFLPHLNWFGGTVTMPTYPANTTKKSYLPFLSGTVVPQIHNAGGLASYNHPFGYTSGAALPLSQQNQLLTQVATTLFPSGSVPAALGCDLLEVGYNLRAGVDLAHHLALWDIMSRNAYFLTGNGTSDDHYGINWRGDHNNWVTSVWAASTGQPDLLAALAAGRAWCGSLTGFNGTLDLLVDGSCPMGSVSVSSVTSRSLAAMATGVPSTGKVQILQGDVDYAGTSGLTDNTKVIASYSQSQLASGSVTLPVDTAASSFIRSQVVIGSGTIVATSNPVWLLRAAPPGGIPSPRAVS